MAHVSVAEPGPKERLHLPIHRESVNMKSLMGHGGFFRQRRQNVSGLVDSCKQVFS